MYGVPDEAIVAEMASDLEGNGFELAPVIQKLLSSAHFFDAEFVGCQIKSPLQFQLSQVVDLEQTVDTAMIENCRRVSRDLGQVILAPPNVAGWKGYRFWLTINVFLDRWDQTHYVIEGETRRGMAPTFRF